MTATISRLYNSHAEAREAVKSLEAAGVKHNDISILASNADNWYSPDRKAADTFPDRNLNGKDDRAEAAGTGAGVMRGFGWGRRAPHRTGPPCYSGRVSSGGGGLACRIAHGRRGWGRHWRDYRRPVPGGRKQRRCRRLRRGPQPSDVVDDPDLTLNEKRAILASWASDACAVEPVPALRRPSNGGRPIGFDEVMDALRALDKQAGGTNTSKRNQRILRRHRIFGRGRGSCGSGHGQPLCALRIRPSQTSGGPFEPQAAFSRLGAF
jgi:hypothetical protein